MLQVPKHGYSGGEHTQVQAVAGSSLNITKTAMTSCLLRQCGTA